MKWFAFAILAVAATPTLAQTPSSTVAPAVTPPTASLPAPDDRARQWLTLVDDGNYADSYAQAGAVFKSHVTADGWARQAGAAREPLGAMSSRTLKSVTMAKTLPGMPDGQYAIVQYESAFAHKAAAIETVSLMSGKDGWSVVGYRIQ
jgi:hypothetical protein